jgi:hypothetical protein
MLESRHGAIQNWTHAERLYAPSVGLLELIDGIAMPDKPDKKCFVISPIGKEGSEVREHADHVLKFIIRPAMSEIGIHVYRSDHVMDSGRITDQMYDSILSDSLCIALLTYENPNVYYELAIAQCAAKPLILLIQRGCVLPFDLHDLRTVEYDLRSTCLEVCKQQIIAHVRSLEEKGWVGSVPFGKHLQPMAVSRPTHDFFPKASAYGGPEKWLGLLKNAEKHFQIMGISNIAWSHSRGFGELLCQKARAGCKIRVLLMDKKNAALRQMINDKITESRCQRVIGNTQIMLEYFRDLARKDGRIEVRTIRSGIPFVELSMNEQRVVWILHLYSETNGYSPLWEYEHDHPLYAAMAKEFDELWEANELR